MQIHPYIQFHIPFLLLFVLLLNVLVKGETLLLFRNCLLDDYQKAAESTEKGINTAVEYTGKGIKKAAESTGKGINTAVEHTAKGVKKASESTQKGLDKAADATKKAVAPDDSQDRNGVKK